MQERLKCNQLEGKVREMSKEIAHGSIKIDNQLSADLDQLMEQNIVNASPFMKLFWKEQVKNFNQRSKRYHPMVIRFCLSMASKSSSMYDELRNSGILCLPSKRTLRDYRNVIPPKTGFIPEVIDQLKRSTENLSGHQRYICIAFDEMKISSGLVFDKHTGEIIGFTSLGDDDITEAFMGKENNLASHALLFSVRGTSSHLCFPVAYFATDAIISTQLIALFWRCVAIMELNCNLWVIATVCDGATANRKFFSLHKSLDRHPTGSDVVYRTTNIFCRNRYIFFISDAPHLMKTARNCLLNSGSGNKARCMWFKDQFILWRHIADIYNKDLESGLKLLPRLSNAHIQLTSYSKMNVSLARQVLSTSVASVLKNFSPKECMATATFCEVFDKFFDCLNVRSLKEFQTKRKPYLAPYTSIDDERFHWLKEVFLKFFSDWKAAIESRQGNFSKLEKEKMFISKQTHVGIQTTVLSLVECVKFLLSNGMPYVLTECFNQDNVEEYFGQQRSIGRRCDNPTMQQFGYNANIIRTQRFVSARTGNTSGKYKGLKKGSSWYHVDHEPLNKRQKKKK